MSGAVIGIRAGDGGVIIRTRAAFYLKTRCPSVQQERDLE
jgi:hypothetical protein